MKRTVVKHGPATLTISLPSTWIKQWKIKKGDNLNISLHGPRLVVSTEEIRDFGSIETDISGLDRTSIILFLRNLYRKGYKEIVFSYKEPEVQHYRTGTLVAISSIIQEEANRLIGMEIIEQNKRSCRLIEVTEASGKNFDVIYRRAFQMTEYAMDSLLLAINSGDTGKLQAVEETHDNVAKSVSYCIRLVNQGKSMHPENTVQHFHILTSLDLILDIIKYSSRDIMANNKKFSKGSKSLLQEMREAMKLFYKLNHDYSPSAMVQFQKKRDQLKKGMQALVGDSKTDIAYLSYLMSTLEIMRMVSETRLSILFIRNSETT